ncbi:MAG: RNA polymerase sigma factor [Verrucomicrobiales bacterium]
MKSPEETLVENLGRFVAFARQRLNDRHLAEDVVQESLLKALQADHQPREEQDVIAWFYRILRRSIIDIYRRGDVKRRALQEFEASLPDEPTEATATEICQCLRGLLPELPPQYREALERIDLNGQNITETAQALNISANNLTVRLHRARRQLKKKVEELCQICSKHGCQDCTCDSTHALEDQSVT